MISRRRNNQDFEEVWSLYFDLQYTAVYLVMMDQFLQEQNSRFQLALNTSDPRQSLAQMGDIAEAEKAFLQNMTSLKTASAVQKAGTVMRAYSFQPVIVPTRILIWGICFVVAWILLFHINIEFILVLGLFIYYRYQEYYLSDRARK